LVDFQQSQPDLFARAQLQVSIIIWFHTKRLVGSKEPPFVEVSVPHTQDIFHGFFWGQTTLTWVALSRLLQMVMVKGGPVLQMYFSVEILFRGADWRQGGAWWQQLLILQDDKLLGQEPMAGALYKVLGMPANGINNNQQTQTFVTQASRVSFFSNQTSKEIL
jgi:hypothetical protein